MLLLLLTLAPCLPLAAQNCSKRYAGSLCCSEAKPQGSSSISMGGQWSNETWTYNGSTWTTAVVGQAAATTSCSPA